MRGRGGLWILLAALPFLALLAVSLGRYPQAGFVPVDRLADDVLLRTILIEGDWG